MEGHVFYQRQLNQGVSTKPHGKTKSDAEILDLNLKRHNYCKIILLIMEVVSPVIKKYITEKILVGNTFQSFLNERTIRHVLFHSVHSMQCCECSQKDKKRYNNPGYKHLFELYACDETNLNKRHRKYNVKLIQQCICKYSAKPAEVENLDLTSAKCVIDLIININCGYTSPSSDVVQRVQRIVDLRNEIIHLSDLKKLDFENSWEQLSGSIMGIANQLGKDGDTDYAELMRFKITDILELNLKGVKSYKNGELCSNYSDTKFKESHDEDKKMCRNLQFKILYDKLTTPDMDTINNYKHIFVTKIKNTDIKINVSGRSNIDQLNGDEMNVDIPVVLHLKVPIGWSKQKIIDSVKGMQLQGTSDMSIHIKSISEDLAIVADVSSSSLKDDKDLTSKIKEVIESIMSESGIDTQKTAVVSVDFDIANNKVDDNKYLHFENVPNQTVKDQFLKMEVALLHKFNFERSRRSSPTSHVFPEIVDCILINDRIVLTDYYNSKLLIHNIERNDNRTIQLNGQPRYMTVIRVDCIAVSYIKNNRRVSNIDIFDINNGPETTIENVWEAGCMTYQDGLLFVVIDGRKITVMNLTGTIERSFSCPSLNISNISSDKDLLYLTDSGINKLFCCDMFGKLKWEFIDDSLQMTSSVTVDRNHNVYVTGDRSKNVIIVSPDGEKRYDLLPYKDIEVLFPIIIRFETANDHLLAYNFFWAEAFILDIQTFSEVCDDNM